MSNLISICIPAYNRPEMLLDCVRAALAQSYSPIEVVISDDSSDDSSETALKAAGIWDKVRYRRNSPALKQPGNVNQLFEIAQGERLVLIHDDDWLLPDALRDLDACWNANAGTVVCYGLQQIASADGTIAQSKNERVNAEYFRTPEYFGVQKEPLFSGLMGQIPNNGYLVQTQAARAVSYDDSPRVSHACDFDFGMRLARDFGGFVLCDKYVSVVRLSENSVLRTGTGNTNFADATWEMVQNYKLPPHLEKWRRERLRKTAMGAVKKWLGDGKRLLAAKALFSPNFPPQRRTSKRALMFVVMLVLPTALNRRLLKKI